MPARRARAGIWLLAVLFFGLVSLLHADDPQQTQLDELRLAVEKLRVNVADLKRQLEQRDALIRTLQENLAIARTESDLFRQRWTEAQLRAQTLGANPSDIDSGARQRQLLEGVRALYLEQAEQLRMVDRLKALLTAVESNHDVAVEVNRTKGLLAAMEAGKQAQAAGTKPSTSTLQSARVVDFDARLQLVVLDVGELQGVRIGMPFAVVRGGKVIAELRVVEVRRRISGGLVERMEKDLLPAAGDVARATKS